MPGARTSTQLTGAAGEYYVAAELSRRGWAASITPKGVQRSDVLAQHPVTGEVVAIQVKTSSGGPVFRMNEKMEAISTEANEWVVFARLSDSAADYYVVPRNVVASFIFVGYRAWLQRPGRGGRAHRPNTVRALNAAEISSYKDRWDWLTMSTVEVPYLLPDWFTALATSEIGLHDGHPGLTQRTDGSWVESQ